MCRTIKTLYNFEPPATSAEIEAAALQFVRKLSGFNEPSQKNQRVFDGVVSDIAVVARKLLQSLETSAPPKDREIEQAKARVKASKRFGPS